MSKAVFENIRNRIYCLICDREISGRTHISCSDCDHLTICIVCFSKGLEANQHKNNHRYSVISKINVPLYVQNWTIQEELLLIEALEKFGYGNWEEITRYIGGKHEAEVEEHFIQFYLNRNIENGGTCCNKQAGAQINNNNPIGTNSSHSTPFMKLSERIREKLEPSFKIAKDKSDKYGISLSDKTGYGQVIGFMPLRQEFEVEYNNDAELYIADMEFSPDDSEMETKTKLCILEIYYSRLQEREEKKRFVIEHDLIDINEVFNRERNMSEDERTIRHSLKDKMPFLSKNEFDELVQCYLREIEFEKYKHELTELQTYNIEALQDFEQIIFNDTLRKQNKAELEYALQSVEKECVANAASKRNKIKSNSALDQKSVLEKNNEGNEELTGILKSELEFCNTYLIDFEVYLVFKEFLIRECYANGGVRREDIMKNIKGDRASFDLIFDFLKEQHLLEEIQT